MQVVGEHSHTLKSLHPEPWTPWPSKVWLHVGCRDATCPLEWPLHFGAAGLPTFREEPANPQRSRTRTRQWHPPPTRCSAQSTTRSRQAPFCVGNRPPWRRDPPPSGLPAAPNKTSPQKRSSPSPREGTRRAHSVLRFPTQALLLRDQGLPLFLALSTGACHRHTHSPHAPIHHKFTPPVCGRWRHRCAAPACTCSLRCWS